MTDAAVPDTRCERCGSQGLRVEWDDDDRKYHRKCQLCGHVQGAAVALAASKPREAGKAPTEEAKVNDKGASNGARVTVATRPDSAASKALEAYTTATTRYLEASEQARVDDQRAQDAQARAKATHERAEQFRQTMAEARAKLDQELDLLTPAGEPKPFSQRVRVRAAPTSKLEPRPCAHCGKLYQPIRQNHRYCSEACKIKGPSETKPRLLPCSFCGSPAEPGQVCPTCGELMRSYDTAPEPAAEPEAMPELVEASA